MLYDWAQNILGKGKKMLLVKVCQRIKRVVALYTYSHHQLLVQHNFFFKNIVE